MSVVPSATDLHVATCASPIGLLTIVTGSGRLRGILWPGESGARHGVELDDPPGPDATTARVVRQLDEYFGGERRHFDLPLDPRGTEFQRAAWLALADIGYGETSSYRALAANLGRPSAARAVGAAVGRNPIPVVLPCHRVVGADGSLTGFAGGLATKRFLLDFEARHR
jgi:methylated-DNA-[protein]-cysteine S-methyltransferase